MQQGQTPIEDDVLNVFFFAVADGEDENWLKRT
jgi:hypothetical protein